MFCFVSSAHSAHIPRIHHGIWWQHKNHKQNFSNPNLISFSGPNVTEKNYQKHQAQHESSIWFHQTVLLDGFVSSASCNGRKFVQRLNQRVKVCWNFHYLSSNGNGRKQISLTLHHSLDTTQIWWENFLAWFKSVAVLFSIQPICPSELSTQVWMSMSWNTFVSRDPHPSIHPSSQNFAFRHGATGESARPPAMRRYKWMEVGQTATILKYP